MLKKTDSQKFNDSMDGIVKAKTKQKLLSRPEERNRQTQNQNCG